MASHNFEFLGTVLERQDGSVTQPVDAGVFGMRSQW